MSKNDKPTFKSYLHSSVYVEPKKVKNVKTKANEATFQLHVTPGEDDQYEEIKDPEAFVHEGEIISGQAHNVLKFDAFSGLNRGISGSLYCTNFKISFVSANRPAHHLIELDRKNQLFKENDIPLTCVDTIFQVSSSKRKQLLPGSSASRSIKMVEIKCKNFKVHTFCFKFTNKGQVKSVMNTILHYAFITSPGRLFAFSFKIPSAASSSSSAPSSPSKSNNRSSEPKKSSKEWKSLTSKKALKPMAAVYRPTSQRLSSAPAISDIPEKTEPTERVGWTPEFRGAEDWENEMRRTGARNLRVTSFNEDFLSSDSLPQYFVVPSVVSDGELKRAAPNFEQNRVPMWCWSHRNGSMLMRMTPRLNTQQQDHEIRMLESITLIHPSKAQPNILDLAQLCPSYRDIQASFQKLHELCMPAKVQKNLKDFWNSDKDWYSNLDATKWMQNISMCMTTAVTAATTIYQNEQTVALKEPEGLDTSCIVATLVQIILDPYFRTQLGFQSLIQREWVIAGHPFQKRCGHLTPKKEGEEAPSFLLFLDCVNQMMQQFPSAFEFTDTYLITLWDSTFAGIFGTFLFNREQEHYRMCVQEVDTPIRLATVWSWTLQYTREDQALFNNPMFIAKQILTERVPGFRAPNHPKVDSSEGCNPSMYRFRARTAKRTLLDAKYGHRSQDDAARSTSVLLRDKNLNINGANSTGNGRSSEVDPNMIIPQTGPPFIKFWTQCYLRWLPSAHIVGGGNPLIYKQQCQVVDEILQLKEKLEQLRARKTNNVVRRPKRESRLYFTYEENARNQGLLTSAFPFSISDLSLIGGDRRSFLGTPLARFLRGQSLMQSDLPTLTANDGEASDEVEL